MTEPQYLFVYGTLRQDSSRPMSRVLRRHGRRIGRATFPGRLYRVSWYPGATDARSGHERVVGDLYVLARPAICLEALDAYEGPEFTRVQRRVQWGRRTRMAWIYLYTPAVTELRRIPGGEFTGGRRAPHTR